MGNGTALGMLADMLAAGINPNMGGGDHAGNRDEMQVIEWCKEMLGYPHEARPARERWRIDGKSRGLPWHAT